MNVEISSFADAGNYQKERLVINIIRDTDIGEYAVLCSPISNQGNPTPGGKSAYWFPDGDVKAGDIVILYTKRGTTSTKDIGGGRTAHFYYWGQGNALWGGGNAAVVLAVDDWIYSTPA